MSKFPRSSFVLFSRTAVGPSIYHLFVVKSQFLGQFPVEHFYYYYYYYYYYYHLPYFEFFTPALADGFSLDFEWYQVLLSVQDSSLYSDLNNAGVWIVYTCLLIPKSSSSCINPLVTVPKAPVTIGITVTFMFHSFFCSLARSKYLSFFLLSLNFTLWSARTAKSAIRQVLFSRWLLQSLVIRARLIDPFVFQNPRGVCASYSLWQILSCAYTICLYDQISISCTIPRESSCPPSRILFYTPSVLICCMHLLCGWSFRLYRYITYICCFVASYLWNDCFWLRCFVLPLEEVQFLSKVFPFLATSTFSLVRGCS